MAHARKLEPVYYTCVVYCVQVELALRCIFIILDMYNCVNVCANKYYNDVPMIYTLCHFAIHVYTCTHVMQFSGIYLHLSIHGLMVYD